MQNFESLGSECARLFRCETIQDSLDLLDIYADFLFQTIMKNQEDPVYSQADADAKVVVQMMLTKTLHLKSIVSGISYRSKDGSILNNIIDPTIVASSIRSVYETVGMFNLIYRNPKTSDEKTILYNLWVYSGLKYRQRFESFIISPESREKYESEKKQLEDLVLIIENTNLYKLLDLKDQNKIKMRLKDKEYLMRFENNTVLLLHWQELTNVIGFKKGIFENIYTYFSLYSHPSNVAVFQFADMFNKEDPSFLGLTNIILKYFFTLTSVFISDYINLFPNVLKTFESLEIRDQIVINYHNTVFRSESYSINDSWKNVN